MLPVSATRRLLALLLATTAIVAGPALAATAAPAPSTVAATGLTVDRRPNPLAVAVADVALSWIAAPSRTATRGTGQSAWQVQIIEADGPHRTTGIAWPQSYGLVWDSNVRRDRSTLDITPPGGLLRPNRGYLWRVRLWDDKGRPSVWSNTASFTTAPSAADWQASAWIGGPTSAATPNPLLRTRLSIDKPVQSARWSLAALGYGTPSLNGQPVTDDVLAPSFTDYSRRVEYVTYDVTDQLAIGEHTLGVALGRGWYSLAIPNVWGLHQAPWIAEPTLRSLLTITYTDGTTQTIGSSPQSWQAASGPTLSDAVFNGEHVDARADLPGWNSPHSPPLTDEAFAAALPHPGPSGALVARGLPAIKVTRRMAPTTVTQTGPDTFVYDFGRQNAGWAVLTTTADAGTDVQLTYGERVRADGSVNSHNQHVDGIAQQDRYVFAGQGTAETFRPQFSYKGYRFVQVDGLDRALTSQELVGEAIHTALEHIGGATTGSAVVDQIGQMTERTLLNNLTGYPTDSPMYEKNGWLGDLNLLGPMAASRLEMTAFLRRWSDIMGDSQRSNGLIPILAPNNGAWGQNDAIEWGNEYVDTVWHLYVRHSDRRTLSAHYPKMAAYSRYLLGRRTPAGTKTSFLGDWISPQGFRPPEGADLTATAYLYDTLLMMSKSAEVLGKTSDRALWLGHAHSVRGALLRAFYDPKTGTFRSAKTRLPDGKPVGYRQTSNAVPLALGIVPAADRAKVAAVLAKDLKARGYRVNTGIVGLRYLLRALSANGQQATAWRVLTNTNAPSVGAFVKAGLTELPEDWDHRKARSLNHFMYGSVVNWVHEDLAGMRPGERGWQQWMVAPALRAGAGSAQAHTRTPFGQAKVAWTRNFSRTPTATVEVTVPAGTTAIVVVTPRTGTSVTEGGHSVIGRPGVTQLTAAADRARKGERRYRLVSGTYRLRLAL